VDAELGNGGSSLGMYPLPATFWPRDDVSENAGDGGSMYSFLVFAVRELREPELYELELRVVLVELLSAEGRYG
jgi:hypothetical protein